MLPEVKLIAVAALVGLGTVFVPCACAKNQSDVTEHIMISAPLQYVFQAIRKQRDDPSRGRSTVSYDGKVAKVDDKMDGVAIYGHVHSLWQEIEQPYKSIDFVMLSSDHFKSAAGKWTLTPSDSGKSTELELRTRMDSGLRIPFSDVITRINLDKDAKERLARLKKWAEDDYKNGVVPTTPPIKEVNSASPAR